MTKTSKNPINLDSTHESLVGISIDGNQVTLSEISIGSDNKITINHAIHSDEKELLETIKLLRHPIHNELNAVEYTKKKKYREILAGFLSHYPEEQKFIVSMAQECFQRWEQTTETGSTQSNDIYQKGIKKCLVSNPYSYPLLFGYSKVMEMQGMETFRFWSSRFDDFLHTAEMYQSMRQNFRGVVSPFRAFIEALPVVVEMPVNQPITVVHPGKLRTYYIGLLNGIVQFIRAIPVGICRDGPLYFKQLSPSLKKIGQLIHDQGNLIMPADTTPSKFFNIELKSPQSEATRFAHQVAEFTEKVQTDLWNKFDISRIPKVYLSGSVSRLKGFNQYLSEKTGTPFDFLSRILSDNLVYDPNKLECCITDYLIPIGNCIAYSRREESRNGLILTDHRPQNLKSYGIEDGYLANNEIYVVEYPRDKVLSSDEN